MHLIQLLLPLYDNDGKHFPSTQYDAVREELTHVFGGLTAFTRAPAEGSWKENAYSISHDDIIVFEIMTENLDTLWWKSYRTQMETRFRQDTIIIRTHDIILL